jgi:hypothetical protein
MLAMESPLTDPDGKIMEFL